MVCYVFYDILAFFVLFFLEVFYPYVLCLIFLLYFSILSFLLPTCFSLLMILIFFFLFFLMLFSFLYKNRQVLKRGHRRKSYAGVLSLSLPFLVFDFHFICARFLFGSITIPQFFRFVKGYLKIPPSEVDGGILSSVLCFRIYTADPRKLSADRTRH